MKEKYLNLIIDFKKMNEEDKKEEIINNIKELLKLLYLYNKSMDNYNDLLPVLQNYDYEFEYLDTLFTYIISLKEETAKLIDKIE